MVASSGRRRHARRLPGLSPSLPSSVSIMRRGCLQRPYSPASSPLRVGPPVRSSKDGDPRLRCSHRRSPSPSAS
nr:hypothetical protein Iba_chr01bCG7700 [Ipomoea batatas]